MSALSGSSAGRVAVIGCAFGGFPLVFPPPRGVDLGPHRDAECNAVEPARERIARSDRCALSEQDHEDGLKRVVNVSRVSKRGETDADDHRPVPPHEQFECRLVARRQEPLQERTVAQVADPPGAEERLEVLRDLAGGFERHAPETLWKLEAVVGSAAPLEMVAFSCDASRKTTAFRPKDGHGRTLSLRQET